MNPVFYIYTKYFIVPKMMRHYKYFVAQSPNFHKLGLVIT